MVQSPARTSRPRILLVDSCRFTREALAEVLDRNGILVESADVMRDDVPEDGGTYVVIPSRSSNGVDAPCLVRRPGEEPLMVPRDELTLGRLLDMILGEEVGRPAPAAPDTADIVQPPTDSTLTVREREVLLEIARGRSSQHIADMLGIRARTVDKHKASIYAKLKVANQAQAVAMAMRSGLFADALAPDR